MSREAHVRFCEGVGVKFPRATHRNIYVGSEASARRVLVSITRWIEKRLRLRINPTKSGTGPTQGRKFLGFTLGEGGIVTIADKSLKRFKDQVRDLWDGRQSKTNLQLREQWNRYVRGWVGYFRLAEDTRSVDWIEGWIRRHIRKFYWQRWHNGKGRLNAFKRLGLARHHWAIARSSRGAWRMAATPTMHQAISNARLKSFGYLMPSMLWNR